MASRSLGSLTSAPITQLGNLAANPLHASASLAETLGVDWDEALEESVAFLRERLHGDYAVDEFGFDAEFTTKIYLPLLRRLANSWFRVEVRGAENLPTDGSALLVSNHAGTLPVDGMILHTVVYDEVGRHVRMLGADLIFKTPFSGDLARKTGTTLACQEDAERLLATNQLVAVFPEGFKGLGKPYADRYKLQRFGRGGFVSAALRAQVPIIPVAIVGSEEIYPLIARVPALARMLGLPYFPITPLFPWLGPLGHDPAAKQVDHRVRRGNYHRRARFRRCRRSHDRVQHHRPSAGDDSANLVRTAHATAECFLLTRQQLSHT